MSIPVPILGSPYGNGDPFVLIPCMVTDSPHMETGTCQSPFPYGDPHMETGSQNISGNGDPFVSNLCMETVIFFIWGSPNPYGDSRMEINDTFQVTTMLPFTKWLIRMGIFA